MCVYIHIYTCYTAITPTALVYKVMQDLHHQENFLRHGSSVQPFKIRGIRGPKSILHWGFCVLVR